MVGGKREVRRRLGGLGSGLDTEQEEASTGDVPWLVQDRTGPQAGGAAGAGSGGARHWAPWEFEVNVHGEPWERGWVIFPAWEKSPAGERLQSSQAPGARNGCGSIFWLL